MQILSFATSSQIKKSYHVSLKVMMATYLLFAIRKTDYLLTSKATYIKVRAMTLSLRMKIRKMENKSLISVAAEACIYTIFTKCVEVQLLSTSSTS